MSISNQQIEAGLEAHSEWLLSDRTVTALVEAIYLAMRSLEPQGDEACSTCGATKPEENVFCSNAFHVPELAALVRTPDDIRETLEKIANAPYLGLAKQYARNAITAIGSQSIEGERAK